MKDQNPNAAGAGRGRDEDHDHRVERPSTREAIEATAAAWLAERDDGLAPEREVEFARWRAENPRHAAAVARLDGAWSALQELRDFRPEAREHPDRDLLVHSHRNARPAPVFAGLGLAAAAVCALALAAIFWFAGRGAPGATAPQRFATTAEGYERVTLADGSLLELNGDSEVSVSFAPDARRVRLLRGEAHFTVAKNPARPFSVEAGAISVRAIGTAFNVRLGARDVEVLVTEGKVDVAADVNLARAKRASAGAAAAAPALATLEANERTLIPLAAPASTAAPIVEKVAADAVREALAWQGPRLIFVDRPLGEVIGQFNRRNHVQIVLADAELEALPIGGSFRAENVEVFVRLLKDTGDITDDRSEPGRIILRKATSPATGAAPR